MNEGALEILSGLIIGALFILKYWRIAKIEKRDREIEAAKPRPTWSMSPEWIKEDEE